MPTLRAVAKVHEVALVVTQPDRPKGRGMEVAVSPVKQAALEFGLAVEQPEKIKSNPEFRGRLEALGADAIIVVGYGRLIPQWMLALPRLGNINLHASLLPKYRGAAPIQWAIANGEVVTGNTTMLLNEGLDTGDVLLQEELAIAPNDTAITLTQKLAEPGAALMLRTLAGLAAGTLHPSPQDHTQATLARILTKEDGRIDLTSSAAVMTAQRVYDRFRGFQPWPGAFSTLRGKALKITSALPLPPEESGRVHESFVRQGTGFGVQRVFARGDLVIDTEKQRLLLCCANETFLALEELQPEGKTRMSAHEFINGYRPQPGERLGS